MDPRNGEIFDHHAELFAQINQDFILDSAGLLDPSGSSKSDASGSTSQQNLWNPSYNCTESGGLLINHNRNMYNTPMQLPSSMDLSDADNTSAIIDSLVKNLPNSDSLLDQYASQHFGDKNSNTRLNHAPGQIYDRLQRISTDKVTEEMLNNLSRLESNDFLGKCNDFESLSWNGAIGGPLDFQCQNRLGLNSQGSIDKNGNSSVFNNTHGDKIPGNFGSFPEHNLPHNNFSTRPSPSASVESNVHTPTASCESASPLSSNRTPIRSDESISPMGSGHTPLRMDDSTSPLASVKTPIRMEEGSPMGRTPLRTEEGFSPAGTSSALPSASPSHKLNGQTPQRCENYSSPPSFPTKKEVRSPVLPSPASKSDCQEEPKEEKGDSESKGDSAIPTIEALIKTNKKIPIPFVSAKRIDDPVLCKKAAKRTLPRKSDSELYLASSSRSENEPENTSAAVNNEDEISDVKTETKVPDDEDDDEGDDAAKCEPKTVENPVDAQKLTPTPAATPNVSDDTKGKKKRKNAENYVPTTAKKRCRKKVTIYQSSMSPEETGIKLKIKLAPLIPPPPRIKKRRSKKNSGSDDEGVKNKKAKKSVRFSPGTREPKESKESESTEQSEWGSKMPPEILQRIFQNVIDEQGCVPSLVR